MTKNIKRILSRITGYWRKRRLYAAYPHLRVIDEAQADAKRRHKAYKHFDKAREAYIASALREGV